jgi:hypothetical protein
MKISIMKPLFSLLLILISLTTTGQAISFMVSDNEITDFEKTIAKIVVDDDFFKKNNQYLIRLYFYYEYKNEQIKRFEKRTYDHFVTKFHAKNISVVSIMPSEVGGAGIYTPAQRDSINLYNFFDYIYQRLESEWIASIEGIYESVDEGNDFEYGVVILKSTENDGSFIAYTLWSTDPEIPVSSTLFKLRPTAVPNKYLTQYWLKNGYKTSNQLTVYNEGILNAGPKSYIKMYPGPNETRKYREINPLVDWDACGSGVLLGPEGIIATNYHVIKGASKIRVKIADSLSYKEYEATLIAQDMETDVAILRVIDTTAQFTGITPSPLNLNFTLGDEVMTLGYPIPDKMGENVKFNKGYISALSGNKNNEAYFQTDLPVWYGNSGGPCFDKNGNLLGLVSEIRFDKGQKLENVCFVTRATNISSLLSTTKYAQNIQLKEATEPANMNDLISRSVFVKVNY